jgi:hypothetical protein
MSKSSIVAQCCKRQRYLGFGWLLIFSEGGNEQSGDPVIGNAGAWRELRGRGRVRRSWQSVHRVHG